MRRVLPALVAASMVIPVGGGAATAAVAPDPVPVPAKPNLEPGSEAAAIAEARRSGRRVEVTSQRSESQDVFANPNGTLTAQFRMKPIRVRRGAGWVPVDTTLRTSGGGVEPVATTRPTVFSGGGRQPLVRLYDGSRWLELRWPAPLPEPVLSKDTATYREVFPGVDLQMRATEEGFAKVFVVKNRAAAANPALTEIRFGLATNGLTARAAGGITFRDGRGESVFTSAAPMMWDSGGRRAVGTLRLRPGQLIMVPDRNLLTDAAVKFPLFVDPSVGQARIGFSQVLSGWPNTPFPNGFDGVGRVGLCPEHLNNYPECGSPSIGKARSFFRFNASSVLGRHILHGDFNTFLGYSPACSPRPVEAWGTNPVGDGTTWNNQPFPSGNPAHLGTFNVAGGYSGSCPGGRLNWGAWDNDFYNDATDPVFIRMLKNQMAFNGGIVTILLKAENESDEYAWKKLLVNGETPYLTVTYNSYPSAPADIRTENKACALAPNEPHVNPYINNDPARGPRGPRLSARISDPDGGLVHGQFEVYARGGSTAIWTSPRGSVAEGASPATIAVDVPSGYATDGAKLSYRMRGADGIDFGAWSAKCDVTIDRTAPDKAPTVVSSLYPECTFESCPRGGGIGRTGWFTLDRNGVSDVVGFRFDLHDQPSRYATANSEGKAGVQITPPDDGPMDLFVRSVDKAGNLGPMLRYHFFVGPGTPPKGHWMLEGIDETAIVDSSSGRHNGSTTLGSTSWRSGRYGDALWLNGTASGQVTTTNGPVLDTSKTFTVAAWVKLDRIGGYPTVLSQDGAQSTGFQLQATPEGRWAFATSIADGGAQTRITSATPARVGAWTHLIGIYDEGANETRLYVNGALAASSPKATAWNATGQFALGRAKRAGQPVDFWPGAIDEVRAYDRALSAEEIHNLATAPATEELFWPLDGSTSNDASGNYRLGTTEGGVTWTAGIVGSGAVRLDGTSGALRTTSAVVRTDNSFTVTAWVVLDQANAATQTLLSQDGSQHSGFLLRYRGDTGRWTFMLSQVETDASQMVGVESGDPARAREWTHLAGVYDAAAKRIRIYVNGELKGEVAAESKWNAAGPFRVGRGMSTSMFFGGLVDDVHVWSGARTVDQIQVERNTPETSRPSAYSGQLGRFVNSAGYRIVTTGPVPPGSHYEGSLGLMAPEGAAETVTIHSCRNGSIDYFLSLDENCAGYPKHGAIGQLYRNAPVDVQTVAVYVCATAGTHFASNSPDCNGQTVVGPIGYARAYAPLVRYVTTGGPADHSSSSLRVPAHYRPEGSLGLLAKHPEAGTTPVLSCLDGTDTFTSTDPACEGKQVLRAIGHIWTAPPDIGTSTAELFRCLTSGGDRFDSKDPGCEGPGHTFDRSLGFLVTEL